MLALFTISTYAVLVASSNRCSAQLFSSSLFTHYTQSAVVLAHRAVQIEVNLTCCILAARVVIEYDLALRYVQASTLVSGSKRDASQ